MTDKPPSLSLSLRECQVCGRPFEPPSAAPHKKFCSEACRNDYWSKKRKYAAELLRKMEENNNNNGEQK